MGQGSTGSYALGSIKGTLAAIAIESKLKEICNVINQHLIPLLGRLNGWDRSRLPSVAVDDLEAISLEDVSKFIQRIAAVGFLPRTPEVVNRILEVMGLDKLPDDVSLDDVLTASTSRSGDGMQQGLNNGTGGGTANNDTSTTNLDNTA